MRLLLTKYWIRTDIKSVLYSCRAQFGLKMVQCTYNALKLFVVHYHIQHLFAQPPSSFTHCHVTSLTPQSRTIKYIYPTLDSTLDISTSTICQQHLKSPVNRSAPAGSFHISGGPSLSHRSIIQPATREPGQK